MPRRERRRKSHWQAARVLTPRDIDELAVECHPLAIWPKGHEWDERYTPVLRLIGPLAVGASGQYARHRAEVIARSEVDWKVWWPLANQLDLEPVQDRSGWFRVRRRRAAKVSNAQAIRSSRWDGVGASEFETNPESEFEARR
jgi:hypothetical protein